MMRGSSCVMCWWIATMLILFLSRDFKTGCNSSSVTANSPSTTALLSVPANAAQVFTPMSLSNLTPCIFAGRPIVKGGDAKPVVERRRHRGVDFVFKENGIAHHHRAIVGFSERGPGAETHERRHRPAIDSNLHVRARKRDFINAFLFVELAFEAGDFVDLCGIQRGQRAEGCRGKSRRQDRKLFHC